MKPETAYVMRSMLFDVIRGGTGTRARLAKAEAFGKTGTSNDFIDAWFIGGAPGLTTAIYAGNDNHTTLGRVKGVGQGGGIVAAPVWKTFMDFAVEHMETPEKFEPAPEWLELDRVSICRTTGFKARAGCPAVSLYMPAGRGPSAECPLHGGNYDAAAMDPNAPRLFLLDQDEVPQDDTVPDIPAPQTPPPDYGPQYIPQDPAPYPYDPSPAEELEERYQELLKQYGIE
jgi:penicillin-binding protein 1A